MTESHQDETTRTPEEPRTDPVTDQAPATPGTPDAPAADAPTIGTGTSLALGCVAGTMLLILIGLIYILILAIV